MEGELAFNEMPVRESAIQIERRGRFWAVLENGGLLCITVYRKGAEAVVARISPHRLGNTREAADHDERR